MRRLTRTTVVSLTALATLTLAGCATNGSMSAFEVGHPEGRAASATLHPEGTQTIEVPNANNHHLFVEITRVNGKDIQGSYPLVLPVGVHTFDMRCTLKTRDGDSSEREQFYGQSQWRLEANTTYTVKPDALTDAYGNSICNVDLTEKV